MEGVAVLVMPSLDDVPRSGLIPLMNGAVGAVLSTVNVPLVTATDTLLAKSTAAPAGIEMLNVPSPVIPEMVTVKLFVLLVTMLIGPAFAVPVLFNTICPG